MDALAANFALRLKIFETSASRFEKPGAFYDEMESAFEDNADVNEVILDKVPEKSCRAVTSS